MQTNNKYYSNKSSSGGDKWDAKDVTIYVMSEGNGGNI